ncbi:MAG: hypothetical protein IKT40_01835 [Bacilli bacterium]|nr:hypothetical protein [Bacilli bacterium]
MNEKTFSDIVAENYTEIERNFRSGLKSKGYPWDEDVMNDAFLSCYNSLKDKKITKQDALKYYWVSYLNKLKTKSHSPSIVDYKEDMAEEFDDIEVTKYDATIDRIYDIIIWGLQDQFGVRKASVWELYTCRGIPAKEIKKMNINCVDNYSYFTKQMKRYINNHIIPESKELKELISLRKN